MRQLVTIFCKEDVNLNAAVRGNKVVLAHANHADKSQQWFKNYSATGNVTDEQGQQGRLRW
ncbi:hypothetical protein ACP70R_007573 [Stipagrostis hirtigluma subsp. patula]